MIVTKPDDHPPYLSLDEDEVVDLVKGFKHSVSTYFCTDKCTEGKLIKWLRGRKYEITEDDSDENN